MAVNADRNGDRLQFVGIEFDPRTGEIWKDGSRTVLPEQLFRVLAMLVREHGSLVSRDDLRRVLWPDETFVDFEQGLNAAIKRLREVLGDSASSPRFIETIPRRGYRFIAALDPVPPESPVDVELPQRAPSSKPEHPVAHRWHAPWARKRWTLAIAGVTLVVAIAATGLAFRDGRWRRNDQHATAGQSLTRLTSTPGLNTDPALSPDGSLVAYASDRYDRSGLDIWVQPVAGGDATRLTADDGDETEPAFSPDGKWVVYAKREEGGIYVVPTAGGEPRALVQESRPRTPRYSPDGRWVLYWTGQPVWNDLSGGRANGTLKVISLQGGAPQIVASRVDSGRFGIWAPDSVHILFLGGEQNVSAGAVDWYVTSREGSDAIRTGALSLLHNIGVHGTAVPGAWDPTDMSVMFSTTMSGESNLWKVGVNADGHITSTPQRLTFGTAIERSPVLARDGRVAFASVSENVDVWRVRLDPASGIAVGPLERITDDADADQLFNVSHDGRVFAYVTTHGDRNALWLRDVVTGRALHIADGESMWGRISPDAATVAITHDGVRNDVALMATENGTPVSMCDDCILGSWSPDGSRIIVRRRNPPRLSIRDVRSGHETPLASHSAWNLLQPRFSPDARWVIFHTQNAPTLRQIYAVPVTGRAVPFEAWVPIVTDFGIQPSWSEDGRGVYHFSLRDGAFCVWLQPVDPTTMHPVGAPRAVQHLHEPRLRASVAVTANNDVHGGYLYVSLTETIGNIWMLHGGPTPLHAAR